MNEKAKKELTAKDQKVVSVILSKSIEVLTKEEKGILSARRSYLTKDELKNFKVDGKVEDVPADDELEEEVEIADKTDYSKLKNADLIADLEKRNIEFEARATKAEMIELLEADDRGELVEE